MSGFTAWNHILNWVSRQRCAIQPVTSLQFLCTLPDVTREMSTMPDEYSPLKANALRGFKSGVLMGGFKALASR